MKKACNSLSASLKSVHTSKISKVMRIILFLSMFCVVNLLGVTTYSQKTELALDLKDVTVEQVLDEIESQSEYYFALSKKLVDINRVVDIKVEKKSINEILDELFKDTDIDYVILDRQIVLSSSEILGKRPSIEQARIINGIVKDESGNGIPGANVVLKGTTVGTITNLDGTFRLEVPDGYNILVISFVGMPTTEVDISGLAEVEVTMKEDILGLDEVIVIGYGTAKKSDLSSSIVSLKGESLNIMMSGKTGDVISGKVAGVQVISSNGEPGSASKVIIRGITTNQGTDPLIVVDGIPLSAGTDLNFLNTSDIENLQVLKDASATSIYGARGSNGVILVTTKRGKIGAKLISGNVSYGFQNLKKIETADATVYAEMINIRRTNDGIIEKYSDPEEFGTGTNWLDELIVSYAPITKLDLMMNSGTENLKVSGTFGYFKQRSNYDKGYWEKISSRINVDYKFSDWFTLRQDLSPRLEFTEKTPDLFYAAIRIDPITSVYLPDEEQEGRNEFSIYDRSLNTVWNPVAQVARLFNTNRLYGLFSNTQMIIEPFNGLEFNSQYGIDLNTNRQDVFQPEFFIDSQEQNQSNSVSVQYYSKFDWVWNNTVVYRTLLGKHSVNVLGGVVWESARSNYLYGSRNDLPGQNEELRYLDAATGNSIGAAGNEYVSSIFSVIGRVMYNYDKRYFLTASVRRDGSSKFSAANRWGTFPSIAGSWDIAKEDFFRVSFINSLRLKAGYGQVGNQEIPASGRFYVVDDDSYVFGGERVVTNYLSEFGNESLKWETVEDYNVGLVGALFGNKISFTLEKYIKRSKDLLFPVSLPYYTGVPSLVWQNVGNFKSSGWDFALDFANHSGNFRYNAGITISINESIVEKIAPGNDIILSQLRSELGNRYLKISMLGKPPGLLYGFESDGVFHSIDEVNDYVDEEGNLIQPNAQPGDLKFIDQNNDGKITDSGDLTVIGNPFPDLIAGLNFNLKYKNWDLFMEWYGSFGNDVLNYSKLFRYSGFQDFNTAPDVLVKTWSPENPNSEIPRLSYRDLNGNYNKPSTFMVEKGSYARLKILQLGYTLKINKINNFRIFLSVQNLLTITNYSGFDPEVMKASGSVLENYGLDFASYPTPRTCLLGINISF